MKININFAKNICMCSVIVKKKKRENPKFAILSRLVGFSV